MSIKGIITDTLCSRIADAIRSKLGTSAPIQVSDFPMQILSIPTGGGSPFPDSVKVSSVTISENTQSVTVPHQLGRVPNYYVFYFVPQGSRETYSVLCVPNTVTYALATGSTSAFRQFTSFSTATTANDCTLTVAGSYFIKKGTLFLLTSYI